MSHTIDSGDIIINGESIRTGSNAIKSVGICMQNDVGLFDLLTVAEHVQLYKKISNNPSSIDLIEKLGLKKHEFKKSNELSGGWKRRLTIACTLINDPDVMILDEITSGVDAVAREELWALLKMICKDKTIIATTCTLNKA
jgi:ABC-type multidrug transport system ATPase subunit